LKEVTEALTERFETRFEKLASDLKSGKMTDEEAREEAERVAKEEGRRATDRTPKDEPSEEDRKREETRLAETKKREDDLRLREIKLYSQQRLSEEDQKSLIPDMIKVTKGMDEDDVDDQIDQAKVAYKTTRKRVMVELRASGWRSPEDLQKLAEDFDKNSSSSQSDDDDDEPGPPSRDRTDGPQLSKERKRTLRDRFGYGPRERAGAR